MLERMGVRVVHELGPVETLLALALLKKEVIPAIAVKGQTTPARAEHALLGATVGL